MLDTYRIYLYIKRFLVRLPLLIDSFQPGRKIEMERIIQDTIDKRLKDAVKETPGACVRRIITPFFLERSEAVLRRRMEMLHLRGLIRCVKTKRDVLCYPIDETGKGDEL